MAVVHRLIQAAPDRVFDVLADGWTYADWVVGTAHVRDVDAEWPQIGTELHHKAGLWPLLLYDKTMVLACDRPRELTMRARLWPWGEATVKFSLEPLGDTETMVRLEEDFARGPLQWIRNKANDMMLHYRNREALRRLADFAERRQTAA
jgi:hypothetical protein